MKRHLWFQSTLRCTHCKAVNTANRIYFQTVRRFPEEEPLTQRSPLGKHDRMQQWYFKPGAVSGVLGSGVIRWGR